MTTENFNLLEELEQIKKSEFQMIKEIQAIANQNAQEAKLIERLIENELEIIENLQKEVIKTDLDNF